MELSQLVESLGAFGLPGLFAALIILVGVFVARKSGIVATGNHARLANIVLSAILFGLNGDPNSETALHSVLASLIAALAFQGIEWLSKRATPALG